jgi:hypothetical protein
VKTRSLTTVASPSAICGSRAPEDAAGREVEREHLTVPLPKLALPSPVFDVFQTEARLATGT